jgi:2-hydroxy-3-keto-5-methylthiopentenyl-1-phosphate phosphatase
MSSASGKAIRLFVDFDGTVTERDVGDGIFTRFMRTDVPPEESHDTLIREWKAGFMSSQDCLTHECANVVVTEPDLRAELDTYELTPGFRETVAYCREQNIPVAILSDGMDYYISHVLNRHGLSDIPFYSNHMRFENGGLVCEFPWQEYGCGRCGNCKRHHMIRLHNNGGTVVYAGDGYSDRFAIKSADVVFARRDLAEFCCRTGRQFIPFEDFHTVLHHLEHLDGNV